MRRWGVAGLGPTVILVEVLLSHCDGRPIRPFEIGKEGSVVLIFWAPGDDSEKLVIR